MKLKTLIQKAIELEEEHGESDVFVIGAGGARLEVDDLAVYMGSNAANVVIETGPIS